MTEELPLDEETIEEEPAGKRRGRPARAALEREIFTCTECRATGLQGDAGVRRHEQFHCRARAERAPALQPIPSNRPTLGWFFRPPKVADNGLVTTGLPQDLFYTASCWSAASVDVQTRKAIEVTPGRWEGVRLVNPIDAYGMSVRNAPVVAMHPPNRTVESTMNWERICRIMEDFIPAEIEAEEIAIDDLRSEIEGGQVVGAQRTDMRQRLNGLEAHLAALREGVDYNGLFDFFVREAQRSQQTLRAPEARMEELIDDRIAQALA